MKKFLLVLAVVSLPLAVSARAEMDLKVEKAKEDGKKLKKTVKKDTKKIVKDAKSETKKAWANTKKLFK